MKNARGNRAQERARDAEGRFESKQPAGKSSHGNMKQTHNKAGKAGGPCRNDMGRFESCE